MKPELSEPKTTHGHLSEFDQRLLTKEELENHWHFLWDDDFPVQWNIYKFFNDLETYRFFCRQWEIEHNGSLYLMERIREQYLIPKIQWFIETLRTKNRLFNEY